MKLCRFRIEQLRQFRTPLVVEDLTPGINLFVGPNESGKSSIVRALRAAFFERHRSSSVEDLQPWGDSAATPTIALEFDWQGERWALSKSFLRQKRCDLRIGGQTLNGEEAEERLAALLGFELSGRGASRPEHWGVPGLLWIEQGAGQEIAQPVLHAGKHLQAVLGSSLGEMMSSGGDALIAEVERERGLLLTAQGRPRAQYLEAIDAHAALQGETAALEERVAQYRHQVDRLASLQTALQRDEAEQLWTVYRAQRSAAQEKLNEIAGWERSQAHEQEALQACEANIVTSTALLQRFAAQQSECGQREAALQAARQTLSLRQAEEPALNDGLQQARAAFAAARNLLQAARNAEQQAGWQAELRRLELELADGQQRVARVEALQTELIAQAARLQQLQLAPKPLKALRALGPQLLALEVRQQALATRLQFALASGEQVLLDGEVLAGEGERLLLSEAELQLPGGGRLRILPGGEDVASLQREGLRLQDEQASLLRSLGVASLAEAELRVEEARAVQEALQRDEAVLQSLAPAGLADLQARQQQALSRQAALQALLASAAPVEAAPPTVSAAQQQLDAAERVLQEREQTHAQWRSDCLLATQAAEAAQREWQQLAAAIQQPDRLQREQAAQAQLIELRTRASQLQAALALRAEQIAAANAALLRQDVERLERSTDALENSVRQRRIEVERLRASLSAQDAEGLEERAALLAAERERAGRREAEFGRRARALDLLLGLLQTQRQALTRQLQAPLQRHLQRYVRLLFPGASLSVNEQLVPELLLRPGRGGGDGRSGEEYSRFEALSFGAREQMGLISRLAYADLLHEAGRPTLLMLDDALVHSDGERLEAMKRVLFDAAERHQILLFSCHPQHWRDLGVAARELTALRGS